MVAVDDPHAPDVGRVVARHLAFNHGVTAPGHVHALDSAALADPAVTLVSARRHGVLLGIGALRHLDDDHAEIKSMHTVEDARRRGVGRTMVRALLALAAARRYRRVSLETGTSEAHAPARSLYRAAGFSPCAPFGEYTENPHSVCMTITVDDRRPPTSPGPAR